MKFLAVAAAASFLVLGSAHAQQRPASPWYGELGYSYLTIDGGDGFKTHPSALRGIVGYDFHPYFAFEGMLAAGVNDSSTTVNVGGVDVNVSTKVNYMAGIYLKPKYEINNVELFGRLGWTKTDLKVNASAGTASASGSGSDDDFSYGLGVNYRFNPRMSVGLDYMRYYNKDGTKIDGINVGFGYRF